ncbi:MAG: hypothetical protein CMG74_08825 [Candidatus Marinimicrobia bacterium]|nr:hypothetical protein [Candidatus Neomarinimicrobiota bacterium]|tara:strand:- start:74516 stop:75292 length:777 start_codon:yes stop_codon:yes gene_type:complete
MPVKTFAIITDIHSNFASLNEALAIIKKRNNIDQMICLGDCFSLGADPEKILDRFKKFPDCVFIRGNHDRYLVEEIWKDELPSLEGMDPYDPICQAIVENEKWTAEKIGDEGIKFINDMKISHREIIGNILVEFTHAWYEQDDKPPNVSEAVDWRDNIMKQNPEIKKFVFVHGHVHVPRYQKIENLTILCQGATGLPFDQDKRGSVAFLTVNDDDIDWEVIRYNYDHKSTIDALQKRRPPFFKNLLNTVEFASIRNDL